MAHRGGGEDYEFVIGFQALKGLQEDGVYGVAWRKGQETGRTKKVASEKREAVFGAEIKLTEAKKPAGAKGKQLFEVYVNRYTQGDAKQTIGMLYMDLSMHIPRPGKKAAKQSACLQLSNCLESSVRLSLTVQCQLRASGKAEQEDLTEVVKQLRDEVSHLQRQNDRMKEEEAYTWSNQPIRASYKAMEEQIDKLKKQVTEAEERERMLELQYKERLEAERVEMEAEVEELRQKLAAMSDTYAAEMAQAEEEALVTGRRHEEELGALREELTSKLRVTVDRSRVKGDAQNIELEELQRDLEMARKEVSALRDKVRGYEDAQAGMGTLQDTAQQEVKDAHAMCEALESQKTCLVQRAEELEEEVRAMQRRSQQDQKSNIEAKEMLEELMQRVRQSQSTEETLQAALAVAEEEKEKVLAGSREQLEMIKHLEQELATARHEEKALAHQQVTEVRRELDSARAKCHEAEHRLQHSLEATKKTAAERDAVAAVVTQQKTRLTHRKKRISDLKRILGLHLKMKQAQVMAGDGIPGSDLLLSAIESKSSTGVMVPAP